MDASPLMVTLPTADEHPYSDVLQHAGAPQHTVTLPFTDDPPHTVTLPFTDDPPHTVALPFTGALPFTDDPPHTVTLPFTDDPPNTVALPYTDDPPHTVTLPNAGETSPHERTQMRFIDINCDMGEGFAGYSFGRDGDLLTHITSANIACGYHASDPLVMSRAVAEAHAAGVGVGAHPGLPDLMGFGRRAMAVSPAETRAYTLYQLGALDAFCRASGARLGHVKPHGALYNMAAADRALADAICDAVASFDDSLIVLGLSGGELITAAERKGLVFASEVFADRAYEDNGTLRSRSLPGAMIEDEDAAAARAARMASEGKVTAWSGKDISIRADTICVHGDGPRAPEFARKIREAIQATGVQITPLSQIRELYRIRK